MKVLKRIYNLLFKPPIEPGVLDLYKRCVQQARNPAFYLAGIPDTVEGRFDLIVLHVYLVMRQLDNYTHQKQQLFDLMFGDMDRSLREMGVGDMSIRKKMRPMISAFYGRAQAYQEALLQSDETLSRVLQRNLYGNSPVNSSVLQALTTYVKNVRAKLETQNPDSVLSGQVEFIEPVFI